MEHRQDRQTVRRQNGVRVLGVEPGVRRQNGVRVRRQNTIECGVREVGTIAEEPMNSVWKDEDR